VLRTTESDLQIKSENRTNTNETFQKNARNFSNTKYGYTGIIFLFTNIHNVYILVALRTNGIEQLLRRERVDLKTDTDKTVSNTRTRPDVRLF